MWGFGLLHRVVEQPVQGQLVAGQDPASDVGSGPGGVVGDGDAVGFLDPVEVVGLEAVDVGLECGDDELVGVPGPVGDVEPLPFGSAQDSLVGEDLGADDVVDVP